MRTRTRLSIQALLAALLAATIAAPETRAGPRAEPPVGDDAQRVLDVLAYHDVRDEVAGDFDPDQYAISTRRLIAHFSWLRENGYTPVDVDRIIAAASGGPPLPERAVLLTFDDGLKSVYTHVLPLLELFGYPAVVSVVTGWIERDVAIEQGGSVLTREDFLTWDEVRALERSGLVEIASHSHDLHRGIPANPQGNLEPAAVTRRYSEAGYESDDEHRARLRADLATSARMLREQTGTAPRIVTWPYGAYNRIAMEAAEQAGMPINLTLANGSNAAANSRLLGRHLILANPDVGDLGLTLLHETGRPVLRAAQVDLDYVYDPDPEQQERNLGRLLDRIKALGISHVFLQAFADPDADGGADALYFPNRHLPMRADLFNRAAWQLKTRSEVEVFAWLPLLAYAGDSIDPSWRVMQSRGGEVSLDERAEPRLSVFEPRARRLITEIYADLAAHAPIDGLLFHDDGRLNEHEDANPAALAAYRAALGPDFSIERAQDDAALARRWSRLKTRALIDFSLELADTVRAHRPDIKTVRNLFASAVLDADAERYLAQDPGAFLESYDRVALMAMPYLENAADRTRFYHDLVEALERLPDGLERTIFELQAVDWHDGRRVAARQLADTMEALQALGVQHLAYYPEDFIAGHPSIDELRPAISLSLDPSGRNR